MGTYFLDTSAHAKRYIGDEIGHDSASSISSSEWEK
jgi:hypothetical protein